MIVELGLHIVGLITILLISCIYSNVLNDKTQVLIDFLMLEIIRLETMAGCVLVTEIETGNMYFLDKKEYLNSKSKYILDENFSVLEENDESR